MGLLALLNNPVAFVLTAVSLVIAITIHEFAHALASVKLGDPTPQMDGRVTLNPLKHLDPIGTVMLVVVGFGWGRPVMFDPHYFKDPVRDTALVAFAGPFSNLVLALITAILFPVLMAIAPGWSTILTAAMWYAIYFNIMLAVFNLIPIHPLDGGKILSAWLPPALSIEYDRFLHQYGTFVLLALILPFWNGTSALSALILPPITYLVNIYMQLATVIMVTLGG